MKIKKAAVAFGNHERQKESGAEANWIFGAFFLPKPTRKVLFVAQPQEQPCGPLGGREVGQGRNEKRGGEHWKPPPPPKIIFMPTHPLSHRSFCFSCFLAR